jgi:hypothetical protein
MAVGARQVLFLVEKLQARRVRGAAAVELSCARRGARSPQRAAPGHPTTGGIWSGMHCNPLATSFLELGFG